MTDENPIKPAGDVPSQIVEKFLAALPESELPAELVSRLRDLFAETSSPKERELKAALLNDE